MGLEQLKKELGEIVGRLEGCQGKVAELEKVDKPTDEQKTELATAQGLYKDLNTQYEGKKLEVEKAIAEAKGKAERAKLLAELDSLTKDAAGAPSGKAMPSTPAAPHNPGEEQQAEANAFLQYVQGKSKDLSGEQRKLLEPRSKILRDSTEASGSVRIPERMLCSMLGKSYMQAFGKTIYSTATPASPNTNPSGGQNLFQSEFVPQLQMLAMPMPTIFDRVTLMPTQSGQLIFPRLVQTDSNNDFGGVVFQWLGEGAEKPETEPVFDQVTIQAYEVAGYTEVSERMLSRSAIQLEAFLNRLMSGALRYTLDTAILTGSGAGQPTGLVNTTGIRTVTRAGAGAVVHADLVNLRYAVRPQHRAGASFTAHDTVLQDLELQYDADGRPLFSASMANGPFDRLTGVPYTTGLNLPALGEDGDVVYGDLSEYIVGMEEEVTLARSEHVKFRENLIAFKIFAVIGGRAILPRAFSILGSAES